MTNTALDQALENIYASLKNENEGLDTHIATLKTVLHSQQLQEVDIDPAKLAQPNRQGRKVMQSYFKQRGIIVNFKDAKTNG